jgi:hypothetical protein
MSTNYLCSSNNWLKTTTIQKCKSNFIRKKLKRYCEVKENYMPVFNEFNTNWSDITKYKLVRSFIKYLHLLTLIILSINLFFMWISLITYWKSFFQVYLIFRNSYNLSRSLFRLICVSLNTLEHFLSKASLWIFKLIFFNSKFNGFSPTTCDSSLSSIFLSSVGLNLRKVFK